MKFYKSLKFKALASVLLLIIILCAAFIRIIPDYSTSRGFAVVSLSDYNKYKQGYCLKENRILPKEELYKRAIEQYLDKKIAIDKKIDKWRAYNYGSSWKNEVEIGYYELADDINLDNWLEKIKNTYLKIYEPIKHESLSYEDESKIMDRIWFNMLNMKKTDYKKHLKINLSKMIAGFDKPIVFITYGRDSGEILLDNAFVLRKNLRTGYRFYGYRINKNFFYDTRKYNQTLIKSKSLYPNFDLGAIDNCGNLDYDIEKQFVDTREAKGG